VPAYQSGLNLSSRSTPDVSYNAAVHGGVLVANGTVFGVPAFFIVGAPARDRPNGLASQRWPISWLVSPSDS
jgi:hypothetical protein